MNEDEYLLNEYEYVAAQLMKCWFPNLHKDRSWLESEDGISWLEIALLDATAAVEAYKEWSQAT